MITIDFERRFDEFTEQGFYHLSGALVELKGYLHDIQHDIGTLIMSQCVINRMADHRERIRNFSTRRFCNELTDYYKRVLKSNKDKLNSCTDMKKYLQNSVVSKHSVVRNNEIQFKSNEKKSSSNDNAKNKYTTNEECTNFPFNFNGNIDILTETNFTSPFKQTSNVLTDSLSYTIKKPSMSLSSLKIGSIASADQSYMHGIRPCYFSKTPATNVISHRSRNIFDSDDDLNVSKQLNFNIGHTDDCHENESNISKKKENKIHDTIFDHLNDENNFKRNKKGRCNNEDLTNNIFPSQVRENCNNTETNQKVSEDPKDDISHIPPTESLYMPSNNNGNIENNYHSLYARMTHWPIAQVAYTPAFGLYKSHNKYYDNLNLKK